MGEAQESLVATVVTSKGYAIITNRIHGGGTEPLNCAFGQGSGTSAVPDEALFAEVVAQGRVAGTATQQTTTTPNDTYQVVGTYTASAARAITEAGLLDAVTSPAQTTLAASMTSGQTTLTVPSAAGFPGSGNYDIQIDSEVMTVTGGQGTTTWTVTRGVNGSTAASHASAAVVTGASIAAAGGNLFMHGDFAVINLASGDTLTLTAKAQIT